MLPGGHREQEAADVGRRAHQLASCEAAGSEGGLQIVPVAVCFSVGIDHVEIILRADLCGNVSITAFLAGGVVGHRPPVRHHDTGKAPFPAKDGGEQIEIAGRPHSVDRPVGAHDGPRTAFPHGDLKPSEIDFPQGALGHHRVDVVAQFFLRVGAEVLDHARHAPAGQPAQLRAGYHAGKKGIFRKIFKIAPVERIAVKIHAGAEQRVDPVAPQLKAFPGKELLIERCVEGGGQTGAVGERKSDGAAVHSDAAGAVRTAGDRDAEATQPVRHSAEGPRDPGSDLWRAHALPPHQGAEIGIGKLRKKFLHRHAAFRRIPEAEPSVSGKGQAGGQRRRSLRLRGNRLPRDALPAGDQHTVFFDRAKPFKSFDGGHRLCALLRHDKLRQGECPRLRCAAHVFSGENAVRPRFEHEGGAVAGQPAVVIRCQAGKIDMKRQDLFPARSEQLCFGKGEQHTRRFAEHALGGAAVNLHHLFAGHIPGIPDRHREGDPLRGVECKTLDGLFKRGIGKAKPERVENGFPGKGLEIPVTDIEILRLYIFCKGAEALCRRITGVFARDGIRQAPAWIHRSGEHIQHAVPALLPALPNVQHGGGVKFRDPPHVDDVAGVKQHHRFRKGRADRAQHVLFRLRQKKAAGGIGIVLIFPRGAADDHNGGFRSLCRLFRQRGIQRHFLLKPRLGCPAPALVERMILQPAPIRASHFSIDLIQAGLLQRFIDTGDLPGVHRPSGARSAFIIVELAAAENGNAGALPERERISVVFQQNNALRHSLPGHGGVSFQIKGIIHFNSFLFSIFNES